MSTKKDGSERLNFTACCEALLKAKGVNLGTNRAGRSTDNLLVVKAYTAVLDLKPSDEFVIKLGKKQLKLIPLGSTDDDEA